MIESRKAREVALCARVAEHINAREGTDYQAAAVCRDDDIGDVKLVSPAGRYPEQLVQVVSIPKDPRFREDIDARQRLETSLGVALGARGINRALVTVGLTPRGHLPGLPRDLVDHLAALILQGRDGMVAEWDDVQVWEYSEELSEYVNSVRLYQGPELDRVHVSLPLFARPASDGTWIKEAIDRKVAAYGNVNAVKDVTLVLEALGLVDGAQVSAFRNNYPEAGLPFAEIWLVSGFEGVVQLKAGHDRAGTGKRPA